mmetsp:Transcript_45261/g.117206  ORF Transcript_45261/g.117206 Transcript_45261/m.117206 type:complete len:278 (-) Transcript_45261:542-1375(-)
MAGLQRLARPRGVQEVHLDAPRRDVELLQGCATGSAAVVLHPGGEVGGGEPEAGLGPVHALGDQRLHAVAVPRLLHLQGAPHLRLPLGVAPWRGVPVLLMGKGGLKRCRDLRRAPGVFSRRGYPLRRQRARLLGPRCLDLGLLGLAELVLADLRRLRQAAGRPRTPQVLGRPRAFQLLGEVVCLRLFRDYCGGRALQLGQGNGSLLLQVQLLEDLFQVAACNIRGSLQADLQVLEGQMAGVCPVQGLKRSLERAVLGSEVSPQAVGPRQIRRGGVQS